MSKVIVPFHLINIANTPDSVDTNSKKFYLKSGWLKLYDGASESDVVLDRPLSGFTPLTGPITYNDSVLTGLEKLQYQISNYSYTEHDPIFTAWLATNPFSSYLTSSLAASTYVPKTRTLTINGVTYDLSANRSWTISAGVWGSITGTLSSQTDLINYLSSTYYPLTNPSGYITSSALTPYLTSATAASTYETKITPGTTSQYWRGDKTWQTFPTIPTVGTWGALNYPTWTSGIPFVKMTATGTFSLDTNTYLTSITSSNVTTALGYTPVTNARTLTINGTTYDLTADRSWTIGSYTLPIATSSILGGIKIGSGVSTTIDGTISVSTNYQAPLSGTGFVKITGTTISYDNNTYVPYSSYGTNNISANNFFDGFTSVVASGTQIVLTVNSTPSYLVTGSGGQTIKLPDATTLPNGTDFYFNNNQSSGAISVNNNSNTLVKSVPSGGYLTITLIDNSTAAGSWDTHFQAPSNVSWSTNTFDYTGSITSATWNGVSIADNRIASASVWNAKFNTPAGTTSQYLKGDGSLGNVRDSFEVMTSRMIFSDFLGTAVQNLTPFIGGALSVGTLSSSSIISDYVVGALTLNSTTTTNSGYNLATTVALIGNILGGEFYETQVLHYNVSGTTTRFGVYNQTNSSSDMPYGCYFEIVNDQIYAKTANNSTRTSVLLGTVPSNSIFYVYRITLTSASSISYGVYTSAGVLLFSTTITTNIPGTYTSYNNSLKAGIASTNSGVLLNSLCSVDYIKVYLGNVNRGPIIM